MQIILSKHRLCRLVTLVFFLLFWGGATVCAQVETDTLEVAVPDTIPADTLLPAVPDTLPPGESLPADFDTTHQVPSSREAEREAIPDAVNFQARDSLTFNFRNQRIAHLYGAGQVRHTSGQLDAGTIELDLNAHQVQAHSLTPEDTLSHPVLTRDGQDLRSTRILYNYETEKGKFEAAEMSIQEGHLIGTQVKNVSRTEVFIEDGIYSTCPPDHMYYYIKADRMKVVDEDEIFFTNARLFILDIPYPLVFPFGYVPAGIDRRRSGLLEPTYMFENTSSRGLGLQNFGWFQYFSDHFTGQTSFDLFTSGTFHNDTRFQYRRTGHFSGSIALGYSSERGLESTDPDFARSVNKNLSITHDQQLSPYANLNANINLRTQNYYRRNSFDLDERARTNSSSRVSYRYNQPEGVYNFSVSSNLNQDFFNNSTTLTGPEATFSLRQFSPFKADRPGLADERWYERISVNYNNNFRSRYEFRPVDVDSAEVNWFEALFNPSKYREATDDDRHVQYGFLQRVQINASQIIPSQYLNIGASANYNEYWYPSTIRKELNEETNRLETFQQRGFATARDFSTSLNFSTTIYGISQMKIGNFEGLRHTLRPTVSFSYRPDFSDDMWGYYREVQSDTLGNTQRYSIFEGGIVQGPGAGEQQTMSFGITNVFETKRVRRDSTGEMQSTTLRLIDNLSVNSGYNFAADSLNFQQLQVSLSSSVLDGIRFRASASYSFYARDGNREINRFIWQESGKFLQPLNYSLNVSTSFSGGRSGGVRITTPPYRPYDPYDQRFFGPVDPRFNLDPVQRADSPWSVGLDFSYRWTFVSGGDARKSAILNANNIQFNLTPKWRVSTRLGYDFIEKELTPSQFSFTRQMECWNLSFIFNPFGDFQYYSFTLSLNSSQISSLFQKLPGLNNLSRSSSPSGRRPGGW